MIKKMVSLLHRLSMKTIALSLFMGICAVLALTRVVMAEPTEEVLVSALTELSLEDLMNIEVVSVGKKSQRLSTVPAALDVITSEDIRRSGTASLPEALRLSPLLHVARVNSHTWAISARGFNRTRANKLLVLMDGRSLYTPLFSGVTWDMQDTMLEDIDRIEVIAGQGGTLWGANAVNGIINIITKEAKETQGLLISSRLGDEDRSVLSMRHGGRIGDHTYYRVYAKDVVVDDTVFPSGLDVGDDSRMSQGGFRIDREIGSDVYTFQGDYYPEGQHNQPTRDGRVVLVEVSGGNLLSRWKRQISAQSDLQLQFYYDYTNQTRPPLASEKRETIDLDFQHRFPVAVGHDLIWGLGYQVSRDETEAGEIVSWSPQNETSSLKTAFLEDEIQLIPERLVFRIGSKFEYNDYTKFEAQPSMRLAWTPSETRTVWTAISRGVKTVSRSDRDISVKLVPSGAVTLQGNPDLKSEEVTSYELGYRGLPHPDMQISLSGFYSLYDHVRTIEKVSSTVRRFGNKAEGETWGGELIAGLQLASGWRGTIGYTYLREDLAAEPDSTDLTWGPFERNDPKHQLSIGSALDLPRQMQLDVEVRYVDDLPNPAVSNYTEMSARFGWRPKKNMELSIGGDNLLHDRHLEFDSSPFATGEPKTEIERRLYVKVTWQM
jgi:iron complex outermembrane receptor protein